MCCNNLCPVHIWFIYLLVNVWFLRMDEQSWLFEGVADITFLGRIFSRDYVFIDKFILVGLSFRHLQGYDMLTSNQIQKVLS